MKVYLRKLQEKDVDGMLEWLHDEEVQKNLLSSMTTVTREMALDFIFSADVIPKEDGNVHLAITDDSDEYMGTISLKNIKMEAKNAELAICLRKKAYGKGIAKEAIIKLLTEAFEKYNFERIYLYVMPENVRAIRLYERMGFVFEGEHRKSLYVRGNFRNARWYSMLKEEFLAMYAG